MRLQFMMLTLAFLSSGCSSTPTSGSATRTQASQEAIAPPDQSSSTNMKREIASQRSRKGLGAKRTAAVNCIRAYHQGQKSSSAMDISADAETCRQAKDAACVVAVNKGGDGPDTGTSDFIAKACEMHAAYGANKFLNGGTASPKCEAAVKSATDTGANYDTFGASTTCDAESDEFCAAYVNKNGDGAETATDSLLNAACELKRAYGAYVEVMK